MTPDPFNKNLNPEKLIEETTHEAKVDPKAMYRMGFFYEVGHIFPKSDTKAFKWYLKAAEAGYKGAMKNIATAYFYGHGVERDKKESQRWEKMALKAVK